MNHLHYGDNLRVLRESVASDSVDLIYLDPPIRIPMACSDTYKKAAKEERSGRQSSLDL